MFIVLPLSTQPKVSVVTRVIAKLIDIFMVFVFAWLLPYPLGPLVGFGYSIFADGMNFGPFRGQSVGKKLLKLQVRSTKSRTPGNGRAGGGSAGDRPANGPATWPASWKDSAIRNTPVGVATFFGIIPIWGWLILGLIGIPLMVMEIYLMLSVESGHRLGDVMADTEVVEVKR